MTFGLRPFGTTMFADLGDTGDADEYFSSTLVATDELVSQHIPVLGDRANAVDTLLTQASMLELLAASAGSADLLQQFLEGIMADEADATDAILSALAKLEMLRDVALATDLLASGQTFTSYLADTLVALDTLAVGIEELMADNANATEALTALHTMYSQMIDSALATDALAQSLRLFTSLADEADASDALLSQASLLGLLEDGADAFAVLRIYNEDYIAWVMNNNNLAMSQYQNYGFNSFAKINGKYYGAKEDGLYLLEGANDEGTAIDAWVRTGLINFGTGSLKGAPTFYIGYKSDNTMVLKAVVTNPRGLKDEYWYTLEARPASSTNANRAKIGRGLRSVYWQFELRNMEGGDFSIDTMRFWPMVLTRRVR